MATKEEINLIVLSSFEKLSYKLKRLLLSDLASAVPDFENSEKFLIKTLSAGVYNKVKANFFDASYRERVIENLERKGIKCITYFSQEYPETLKNIPSPPIVLFCRGNTKLLKTNCFSVVGSRNTLTGIYAACKEISGELTKAFTVVSGLAEGADTAALEGALAAGGNAIAVLANGLDCIYPASNANLLKKIEREGLVITEYLPDVQPKRYYFPVRNRIIAGLSRGTLIVSAKEKSGALITAEYAAEFGRDVFAFPYSVGVASGEGCNYLIKKGACLTRNILDIFTEYGLDFNTSKQISLNEQERLAYETIRELGTAFLPKIAEVLGKQPFEILPIMITLEMYGLAVNLGGNRYGVIK